MTPLPLPNHPRAIVSLDFDGTLHHPGDNPPVPDAFFEQLRQLRASHGVLWGINTGRTFFHLMEGMIESRFPFAPDWLVTSEREIRFVGPKGDFLPHKRWNRRGDQEIHQLFAGAQELLQRIRSLVDTHTGAQWLDLMGEPASLIARNLEEMDWIVEQVRTMAHAVPTLGWQRNSIYLRFGHRDFQKGSSLAEIAQHYEIPVAECYAMGDGQNDEEMLAGEFSGRAACPLNSVPEIKIAVKNRKGLVTQSPYGQGVVEALKYWFH